ncbi:MAG: F0F1 ATP synthase subunit A [Fusobacteriota bacterium]
MELFGIKFTFFSPEKIVTGPEIMFRIPNPLGEEPLPISETVTTTWFIMIFFAVLFWWGTRKLEDVPSKRQAIFEVLYDFHDWLTESVLGEWKSTYLTFIATLVTYLFLANTISFFPIPWISAENGKYIIESAFSTPTSDLNTPVGLALISFAYVLVTAIGLNGFLGYLKSLVEPVPFMLPINIIGEIAKPVNISMRLFGNMFGGLVIMGLLYKFAPAILPAPLHLYFDIFSGLIQSFIFTMLTMVYLITAVGDAEKEVV